MSCGREGEPGIEGDSGVEGVLAHLPHRAPFRFLTTVEEMKPGESAVGSWRVTGDEAFFLGHFPGEPVIPGVLLAEAAAQLSGLVMCAAVAGTARLARVDVRFPATARPPATVVLRSEVERVIGGLVLFDVTALVGEVVVATGGITLSLGGGC